MLKRFPLIAFLFLISLFSWSQSTPTVAAKDADYSQEGIVIDRLTTRVVYEADGSGTRETTAAIRVQAEAGVKNLAVLTFAYTSANESVEFDYVRVRKADGTTVPTPAYNIQDLPAEVTRVAPMYSDIHEKHVTVKALGVGDVLEYLVRYRTTKPQVPGHFWFEYNFEKDVITRAEELVIDVPSDKYANVRNSDLKPEAKEDGKRRIYLWKSSNLKHKDPDSEVDMEDFQPSVQLSTFRSWEELGRWWRELQAPQVAVTPALQAKAAEVTKGLTTDEARIRALYNYVSTRFHYISLSFGIGRYQPHAADEVLDNEYGDCKDKHTLLAALLKASGYDAWPALINSLRKIDTEIPSPGQFNHVITVVPLGSKLVWLDTTPEVAPFSMLLANLRDKQALVVPSEKAASLMKTPEFPPFPTTQSFTAEGKLTSEGSYTGHVQVTARGDAEILLRLGFRQVPQANWKELAQQISSSRGFGGEVSEVVASRPEDTEQLFQYSYSYLRKKYGEWENRRITAPLPPFGIEAPDDEKKPKKPYLLGAPGDLNYRASIELPPGYTIAVPANVDLVRDFIEYHAAYSLKDHTLTAVRQLLVKKKEVPLSAWDEYCKFRKAVMDDEYHWIDLKGGSASTSAADSKFQEGSAALASRNLLAARKAFETVLELNPKYQGAHGNLAMVSIMQGDTDAALQEFRKEEDVSPSDARAYNFAANLLISLGRRDDAIEEWRKLLKIDPANGQAAQSLSSTLISAGKYADAIQVLEAGTKARPDDAELCVALGAAYLKSGQKEQALATMQSAVAKSSDGEVLNSAAYELAEARFALPQALEWAEKAVREAEDESLKLQEKPQQALGQAMQFAARWDTLGWVYFRLGQSDKALPYLRSSWSLGQHPVVGDHLAQLYQHLGRRSEAEHLYRLAFGSPSITPYQSNGASLPFGSVRGASSSKPGLSPEKEQIRQHFRELTGREPNQGLEIHRLPNGKWTPTPGEELSTMRTYKITQAARPAASASFVVAFSPGKVGDVQFISGGEALKSSADSIARARFSNVEFPNQHPSRLVRKGILTCGQSGCDFVLLPPETSEMNLPAVQN